MKKNYKSRASLLATLFMCSFVGTAYPMGIPPVGPGPVLPVGPPPPYDAAPLPGLDAAPAPAPMDPAALIAMMMMAAAAHGGAAPMGGAPVPPLGGGLGGGAIPPMGGGAAPAGMAGDFAREFARHLILGLADPAVMQEWANAMQAGLAEGGPLQGVFAAAFNAIGHAGHAGFAEGGAWGPAFAQLLAAMGNAGQGAFAADGAMAGAFNQFGAALNNAFAQWAQEAGHHFEDEGAARQAIQAFLNNFQENIGRLGDIMGNAMRDAGNAMREEGAKAQEFGIKSADEWGNLFWGYAKGYAKLAVAVPLSYFTFKYGGKVFWDYIDRKLKRPKLLLESSKTGMLGGLFGGSKAEKSTMVFSEEQKESLGLIIKSTHTINEHIKKGKKNATYRNVLLFGPPGTGKTMFAKKLAKESGMDFAELTGASLSQFKDGSAITEIDKLFKWANKESSKGVIIFIDEVDSLLIKRESLKSDSEDYKTVNHILNHTGERSNKFMLIMTTNHKDNLDTAIYDRIDDYVEMALPDQKTRQDVLSHYMDKIFFSTTDNDAVFVKQAQSMLTPEAIADLAAQTEGFSNRSLHGFVNMLFSNTLSTEKRVLTKDIISKTLTQMRQKIALMEQGKAAALRSKSSETEGQGSFEQEKAGIDHGKAANNNKRMKPTQGRFVTAAA